MKGAKEQSQTLLLDVEVGLETQRHTPRPWRWAAAALAVSLCVAAAVLLTWRMQDPDQSQEGSGLQLKLRELAGSDKAAIHLEAEDDVKPPNSVLWSKDTGHAFYQGGLDLENNEIVIPREGLYFVYSQASFRTNCHTQSGAGELVHISHAVDRFSDSYGGTQPLMSALRPTCVKVAGARGSGKRWHSGIYLGGVFRLLEGDRLSTVTKDLPSLDRDPGKTFFGAFTL